MRVKKSLHKFINKPIHTQLRRLSLIIPNHSNYLRRSTHGNYISIYYHLSGVR